MTDAVEGEDKITWQTLWGLAIARLIANRGHPLAQFFLAPWHDPVAAGVVDSALNCERRLPGLGPRFITELCELNDFDMLLQKLAELYVLGWLCALKWPEGAHFAHEPQSPVSGKRPELVVDTADGRLVFEVKAPKLADFRRARSENPIQLVGRMASKEILEHMFPGVERTLPRDNPIKDFLVDADEKFQGFKNSPQDRAYLVVVWDGHLHEPISALIYPASGLFTSASFARDAAGAPLAFPQVDGVVMMSRLGIFINTLEGEAHPEGPNMMTPMRSDALPTALALAPGGQPPPDWLFEALRIVPAGDPGIPVADLQPLDYVFWLKREGRSE